MAGIYINFSSYNYSRLDDALIRLKYFQEEHIEIIKTENIGIVWASHDSPELFGPAFDPKTGVRVITFGRVSWQEAKWQEAERLAAFKGGLSCRLLLKNYLDQGARAIERPNGPAVVIVYDPRYQKVYLVTDHFGYQPVFLYCPHDVNQCVIATHPDVLAKDSAVKVTPDKVSMVEFLSAWRVTPPHTYYNEIKYAGAARLCTWDISKNTFSSKEYWTPAFKKPAASLHSMVDQLEYAIRESIKIRTLPHLSPVTILVSGGMDSRNMLFSCAAKESAVGINMFVKPSRESAISAELCKIAGVRYIGVPLRDDYYPRWAQLGAKLNGGMNLLEDNHYLGIRDIVQQVGTKTILSACTADWLFKGYGIDKDFIKFMGKNLPVYKFLNNRKPGFPPNAPGAVPNKFSEAVANRHEEWYFGCPQELRNDADRLRCEDKRIRPACYAVSISGPIMYRAYPYDTFFGDRLMADCYATMKASWKINGKAWGMAAKRICSGAEHIVDANWGAPLGASVAQKFIVFGLGWLKRRLQRKSAPAAGDGVSIESGSSWPNMGWYVLNSETIHSFWTAVSASHRLQITEVLGHDPWVIPLNSWAHKPAEFFRILTLLLNWSVVTDTKSP